MHHTSHPPTLGSGPPLSLETIVDALPHGLALVDERGVVVATNRLWDLAGGDGDVVTVPVDTDLPLALRAARGDLAAVADHAADGLGRLLDGRGSSFQVQYQVHGAEDPTEVRWFLLSAERLPHGGLVMTRTETTVHHSVNDVLADLAFHDDLTGLPNRGLLMDRIRMALIRAQRLHLLPLVVFVDLDGFKAVNDAHGHAAGDAVLVEAARRLSSAVREGDTCGRWGGDEFVLVVELGSRGAARRVIERLRAAFDTPIALPDGAECRASPSIGAVVATGSERVEALLHHADEAMYRAKRDGSGAVIVGDDPHA
ncbi:MAG TPA: GGDEF domain-containing protein [Acidimicrobiales bacterium]|nr:GGDEF domain-containing protein [Acidimicrobiales bacterium]